MTRIPEGFAKIERLSPFNALVGPLYQRRSTPIRAASATAACWPRSPISPLAMPCWRRAAKAGDWVESAVEIQHVGSRLAFANCYLMVGAKPIVRASAIFAREGKNE
jgi:hypothetical protein